MTMIDTLFGLIPASSRGQQWVADELQLVNWGGYDGAHRVRFSPEATLLCGGSGSGKSTLMDAYIALMMPHTTPFNGASNGAVTGRPRGEEQRNILSYGRGKLDESRGEEGTKLRVLRGDSADTWTAIAMSWIDHDGSRFTAIRAWYIPVSARALEDTVKVRANIAGPFNVSTLETAVAERLSDASLRGLGLQTHATDREFSAKLHSVLGIGAAGSGAKAMSLLARIQAGQQITTVDELYKRMVLEEPETLATADAVVEHFDELEETRMRMVTAQKQVTALRPILGMKQRIEQSRDRLRLIDEIGEFRDPASLATLWRTERRLELLRAVETELLHRKRTADAEARELQASYAAAESQRDGLEEVYRAAGGDKIERAERDRGIAEGELKKVRLARSGFDQLVAQIDERVAGEQEFQKLQRQAHTALADPLEKKKARERYADARNETSRLSTQRSTFQQEREQAEGQRGNIPVQLTHSRELLARAAGMQIEDLPFVGELVEVRTEFEPWREAFNLALGGFATTLLIDTAHLARFRRAINEVRTPVRLRYEGAPTKFASHRQLDSGFLPGRLDLRESDFSGWLINELERRFGFACVETPEELSQHRMALTITGQQSQGQRGAHGGHGAKNVLGFSNDRRLRELDGEIAALSYDFEQARTAEQEALKALDGIETRLRVYEQLEAHDWSQLDVDAAEQRLAHWQQVVADLIEGEPNLGQQKQQIADAKALVTDLLKRIGVAEGQQRVVAEEWAKITEQVDSGQDLLDTAEEQNRALSEEQNEYLGERFHGGGASGPGSGTDSGTQADELRRFDAALDTASRQLREDQERAQTELSEQFGNLRDTLERFLESWPNPNLRADPETSFGDFARILAELETSGLHELEAEWKKSLVNLSGNDLTNLDSTMSRSIREIRERIEPINRIMQDLPFYDETHRLQISPRENQSERRSAFRKELRDVRKLIETIETEGQREAAYLRMARLIGRVRRTAPDFAELIDVRNHVRVSAEKVHAVTKQHVALYDHIGEKSGGESQELIAFIVGAALRYQLGDADAERPRYAPVFLDEALIKADAHFTKRAIGAWRGLGFQLIIGAPNDKYSAIEPHVDVEYDILKDTSGRSWARPKVGLHAEGV